MDIQIYSLGQLQTNCYFLTKGNECLIIDPGDDASFLLEELSRQNLTPLAIIATHGHFDHVMAVGEIQAAYQVGKKQSSLPFYFHPKDQFLVDRLGETAKYFLGHEVAVTSPLSSEPLKKGIMNIGPFSFTVMHTPGHTPGGTSLLFQKEGIVFTGDTLFHNAVGRYDFSYCSKSDLQKSIEKLLKLPSDLIVYSGHGRKTTIGNEREIVTLFF